MLKNWTRWRPARTAAGRLLGAYLRLVRRTTRFVVEPEEIYDLADAHMPVILTTWHGQHLLAPLMRKAGQRMAVLVSRSFDGELNAAAAESIGWEVIRGSGGRSHQLALAKGGAVGFRQMLAALESGMTVAQTADVPGGTPRRCGLGVVKLAQRSGRPIVPIAAVTQRSIRVKTRDRMRIPLPFGRGAFVVGMPVYVARDADAACLEQVRRDIEESLNRTLDRADELANARRR